MDKQPTDRVAISIAAEFCGREPRSIRRFSTGIGQGTCEAAQLLEVIAPGQHSSSCGSAPISLRFLADDIKDAHVLPCDPVRPPTAISAMIEYSVYTSSDEDEMVRLLADVFPGHDPPAIAVGLTSAEFEPFVRLLCSNAATDQLTCVARSAETGEMVGALLTQDSASDRPTGMDQLSSKFGPIFEILGQLDAEYRAGSTTPRGESMHLFLLGVAPRFGGQGIAQQLVSRCVANGATRGYRVSVTEATNRTSQHVFRKQGFVERVHRSYQDYHLDGRACFTSIAEEGGPILMDKLLLK